VVRSESAAVPQACLGRRDALRRVEDQQLLHHCAAAEPGPSAVTTRYAEENCLGARSRPDSESTGLPLTAFQLASPTWGRRRHSKVRLIFSSAMRRYGQIYAIDCERLLIAIVICFTTVT
jgi:hypothetical protein